MSLPGVRAYFSCRGKRYVCASARMLGRGSSRSASERELLYVGGKVGTWNRVMMQANV